MTKIPDQFVVLSCISFPAVLTIVLLKLVDGLHPGAEGFSASGETEETSLKQYLTSEEFYTSICKDEKWGALQTAAVRIVHNDRLIAWLAGDFDVKYVKCV